MTGARPTIDVAEIIERQRLSRFVVRIVLVSWLVTFFDGYDMNVIAFAAPYIASAYHIDKLMLGNIFSAGTAGTLVGGFLFGFLGDRFGSRTSIILATATFGILMLALAHASTYAMFLTLRFLNGVALGGAIPLTWALGIEYVPVRYRATAVTLVMLGYGFGVTAAGPISVTLIPKAGWPSVFVFGGCASLFAALALFIAMPESLRFLVATGHRPDIVTRIVRRLAPGRIGVQGARFVASDEPPVNRHWFNVGALFAGRLRRVTPLLWIAYIASSMTSFFFTSWRPLVYESLGFSRSGAAWLTSLNSLSGAAGGLALMRFTDRYGALSVAAFPAIATPILLLIGFVNFRHGNFVLLIVLLSIFLNCSHYGITSIAGLFYLTGHRAVERAGHPQWRKLARSPAR